MTISAEAYFQTRTADRKKEPRYLAVIDKDSCTSCNACATVCPVDCIYEVVAAVPAHSYHVIDSARCIGCQLCYRIPSESTERYTLELCPWNAIDLLYNPNVSSESGEWVLAPYYLGPDQELPWPKLDEYGYQLFLNREIRIPSDEELVAILARFEEPNWGSGEDVRQLVGKPSRCEGYLLYRATAEGHDLLSFLFQNYPRLFLD